jgi:hypothetical protein
VAASLCYSLRKLSATTGRVGLEGAAESMSLELGFRVRILDY